MDQLDRRHPDRLRDRRAPWRGLERPRVVPPALTGHFSL
jgi:hypothetical protein